MTAPERTSRLVRRQSIDERERCLLAPYAMHSADTAGREHAEPPHPYRGPFQRDRDRIVHCAAYRRLSYKTQVFTGDLGDYHRTRLTHTQEVASIARALGRALRLNEDLIEALALLHDIGHPPFGHTGEDVLSACLADEGGFNHNEQALRTVELLETRYYGFPGLNLSHEVLDGQRSRCPQGRAGSPLLEVQVVDAADSIAYDTHDADDALELGLLTLDEMLQLDLWHEAAERVHDEAPSLAGDALRRAVIHELINWQVGELLSNTEHRLEALRPASMADVGAADSIVVPQPEMAEKKRQFEAFLFDRVYRHPTVVAKRREASAALDRMFGKLHQQPNLLPAGFQARSETDGLPRAAADYLAGMTDRYALRQYEEWFGNRSPAKV